MDLVLLGGHVLTMDGQNRRAEAVAVQSGKIAEAASSASLERSLALG